MGAVVCPGLSLGLVAAVAAGCGSGGVTVQAPELSGSDRAACEGLVDVLPEAVSDQERRPVEPADAPAAAWGDPAIVLVCGVPTPEGLDEFATCHEVNGVGWFIPESQTEDEQADVVMTTIGRELNVQVRLPARYRPPAAAMVDLADAVKQTISEDRPCV